MTAIPKVVPLKPSRDEKAWHFECPEFQERYPSLFELLATPEIEGMPRQPASFRLFLDAGRLKAACNDETSGMVAYCTLDASGDVLEQLERYFASGQAEWRRSKYAKK